MRFRSDTLLVAIVVPLLLSTWGPPLLSINGYYVPEVAMAIVLGYLIIKKPKIWKNLEGCVFSGIGCAVGLWLIFDAILGVVMTGGWAGPYSELRSSLVLVYSFIYFYRYSAGKPDLVGVLFLAVLVALCLDFLLLVLQATMPGFLSLDSASDYTDAENGTVFGLGRLSIPAIGILAAAYLSSRKCRVALLFMVLLIGAISSLGGHRLILLITMISMLFVPLCLVSISLRPGIKRKVLALCLSCGFCALLLVAYQSGVVGDYLERATAIRYRLYVKTVESIEGVRGGFSGTGRVDYGEEGIRAAYVYYIAEQWPRLLLPHGLGAREVMGRISGFDDVASRFGTQKENGNTHDMTILYMAYHHGLLVTGFWLVTLMILAVRRLTLAANFIDAAHVGVVLLGIVAIDMVFPSVPGINLSFIYGALLGVALCPPSSGKRRQ